MQIRAFLALLFSLTLIACSPPKEAQKQADVSETEAQADEINESEIDEENDIKEDLELPEEDDAINTENDSETIAFFEKFTSVTDSIKRENNPDYCKECGETLVMFIELNRQQFEQEYKVSPDVDKKIETLVSEKLLPVFKECQDDPAIRRAFKQMQAF